MSKLLEQINNEERTPLLFSDYIKIKHGFAFKGEYFSAQPTSDILVTPGNFAIGGGFKSDKFKYYKGIVPEEYILKPNDLVVTMTDLSVDADTLGYSALVPKSESTRFLHNQRVGLVQKKQEGIDFGYLYYLMRTREYQKYVVSTASGSTVKHTSPDRVANYSYDFPSLETQKKIAEILSAYDAKIENNNKIIKNLEATAQTIFNEWFVEFHFPGYEKVKMVESEMGEIPEGWELSTLGKVSNNHDNIRVPLSSMERNKRKGNIPYYGANGILDHIDKSIFSGEYILFAEDGTVKTSKNTPVVYLVDGDFWVNNHAHIISGNKVSNYFVYLSVKQINIDAYITGGVQPKITQFNLNSIPFLLPEKNILSKFEKITIPIKNKIKFIEKENISLKSQRDQLLAKLI